MVTSTATSTRLLSPVADRVEPPLGDPAPLLAFATAAALAFAVDVLALGGLRGTVSGASGAINALAALGALLAQLCLVSGVILTVHVELALLRSRASWVVRAFSVPALTLLCLLLMNAAVDELAPLPLLAVGLTAALLALLSGTSGVFSRRSLGGASAPPFLLAAGVTSALWTAARLSAWQTTTLEPPPFYAWSPWLASGAWAASGALTIFSLRFLARHSPRPSAPLLGITLLAVCVAWAASAEATYADSGLQVFARRAMRGLLRGPLPVVPESLVVLEHLLGLGAGVWALAQRSLPRSTRVVLALCLLASRGPDLPLFALALALAALFGALPGAPANPTGTPPERAHTDDARPDDARPDDAPAVPDPSPSP